jgi:hypothetical protein
MTNPEAERVTEEVTILPIDINLDQLLQRLLAARIPIDEYGKGAAKTINHLLSEINEGEAILTVDTNKNVYRQVNVLWLDVICNLSNGDAYILKEDRQEFKDGRVKVRSLDSSIGEKLKPFETIEEGVARALQEEIGVDKIDSLYDIGYQERTFIPDTFPGIESTYKMYKFASVIPETSFVPEGYIEEQSDKTNYYTWELIHKST